MVPFKLIYFGVRGRAEGIRYILHHAGQDFEDMVVPREDWPAMKTKMPMGQVPVLQLDNGELLCQSTAIGRYLARKFDLTGADDYDAARCDMLVDGIQSDVMPQFRPMVIARMSGDKTKEAEEWTKLKTEVLPPFLKRYEALLKKNACGFFVGNKLTWADLWIGEIVQRLTIEPELLAGYPELSAHYQRIHQLPNIQKYVASGKQPKV